MYVHVYVYVYVGICMHTASYAHTCMSTLVYYIYIYIYILYRGIYVYVCICKRHIQLYLCDPMWTINSLRQGLANVGVNLPMIPPRGTQLLILLCLVSPSLHWTKCPCSCLSLPVHDCTRCPSLQLVHQPICSTENNYQGQRRTR